MSIYTAMIRYEYAHAPYQLLGFTMGGVIVCEAAQQLRRAASRLAMANALRKGATQPESIRLSTTGGSRTIGIP